MQQPDSRDQSDVQAQSWESSQSDETPNQETVQPQQEEEEDSDYALVCRKNIYSTWLKKQLQTITIVEYYTQMKGLLNLITLFILTDLSTVV